MVDMVVKSLWMATSIRKGRVRQFAPAKFDLHFFVQDGPEPSRAFLGSAPRRTPCLASLFLTVFGPPFQMELPLEQPLASMQFSGFRCGHAFSYYTMDFARSCFLAR
jgi:hypothetical protein